MVLELPIALAIAWIACHWLTHRLRVPNRFLPRAVMGVVGFLLLMAAEGSISLLLAGRGLAKHIELYRESSHLLGLAGQVMFAIVPLLQAWTVDRRPK